MLTIDWIRHTSLKTDGTIWYGQTEMPVSDTFPQEAREVKETLSGRHYDKVFTSPLSRAALLCYFCGYTDAIREPRVMEMNFGEWEMAHSSDVVDTEDLDEWFDTWHLKLPPSAETHPEFVSRVKDFIDELRRERLERVAVFCHGGVINVAEYLNGDIALNECFRILPPYGSITSIEYTPLDQNITE